MKAQSNSAIGIVLRAITNSTVSLAVQVAMLRVGETLASLISSGLVTDFRQLRKNLLIRDSASATNDQADAKKRLAEAVKAENEAAESKYRALAETRRLEAEADSAAIHAKREADMAAATETLKATIRNLMAAGGAVLYEAEGDNEETRVDTADLLRQNRAHLNAKFRSWVRERPKD